MLKKIELESYSDLIIVDILAVLAVLIIGLTELAILHAILGAPLIFLWPGYSLMAALFPKKETVDFLERFVLSLGLSIAITPLIGLALTFTPWGIRLQPLLLFLGSFTLMMSGIGIFKRSHLTLQSRFMVSFGFNLIGWSDRSRLNKSISLIIGLLTLTAVIWGISTLVKQESEESSTEFYILGPSGKVEGYPRELKLGESSSVVIVIINQEGKSMGYRVEVDIDGDRSTGLGPINLLPNEKKGLKVDFKPTRIGQNQRVEFILYKDGNIAPDTKLHLWVDVNG